MSFEDIRSLLANHASVLSVFPPRLLAQWGNSCHGKSCDQLATQQLYFAQAKTLPLALSDHFPEQIGNLFRVAATIFRNESFALFCRVPAFRDGPRFFTTRCFWRKVFWRANLFLWSSRKNTKVPNCPKNRTGNHMSPSILEMIHHSAWPFHFLTHTSCAASVASACISLDRSGLGFSYQEHKA